MEPIELFRLAVAAAGVDGRIDPAERQALERVAREVGLSDELAREAIAAAAGGGKLQLRLPGGAGERRALVERLAAVVCADGVVTERERAFLGRIAERAGVPVSLDPGPPPGTRDRPLRTLRCLGFAAAFLVVGGCASLLGLRALIHALFPSTVIHDDPERAPAPPPVSWALLLEGTHDARGAAAPDGGLYVAGTFHRGLIVRTDIGRTALTGTTPDEACWPGLLQDEALREGFLLRLDAAGEVAWWRPVGRWARTWDLEVDAEGRLVVAGDLCGQAELGGAALAGVAGVASQDAFVAAFTPAGELAWSRSLGTPERDQARSLTALPDGGVLVTARQGHGLSAFHRLDRRGEPVWTTRLEPAPGEVMSGEYQSEPLGAVALPDGGLLCAGWSRGALAGPFRVGTAEISCNSAGRILPAGWVGRLDPDGSGRWAQAVQSEARPGEADPRHEDDIFALSPAGDGAAVLCRMTSLPEGAGGWQLDVDDDRVRAFAPGGALRWSVRVWGLGGEFATSRLPGTRIKGLRLEEGPPLHRGTGSGLPSLKVDTETVGEGGETQPFRGHEVAGTLGAGPRGDVYLQGAIDVQADLDGEEGRTVRLGGDGFWEAHRSSADRGYLLTTEGGPGLFLARLAGADGAVRWAGVPVHGFIGVRGEGELVSGSDGGLTLVKPVRRRDRIECTEEAPRPVLDVKVSSSDGRTWALGRPHARSVLVVRLAAEAR